MDARSSQKETSEISLKPFVIAFLLVPLNSYWLMQLEIVRGTNVSGIAPLSSVIFTLLILTAFNGLLQKLVPAISLNQAELLIIYIILSLATILGSIAVVGNIISIMGHAFWFATPENEWKELLWRHIPRWLAVDDRSVLRGYYRGGHSLYTAEHLRVWLTPILCWVFIISTLSFATLCLNVVIRRQWSDRERLTYPTVRLPMELTRPKLAFFRNRLMWIGFGIAASISLINGLSFFYPTIPRIPVTGHRYLVRSGPLSLTGSNAPGVWTIAFYPFAIGIGFLMPLDVMSSTLFFFASYRAQASSYRFFRGQEQNQIFGSLIGLSLLLVWTGRRHLAGVIRTAFGVGSKLDDSGEPMPYRTAILGGVVSLIVLSYLLYRAGMSLWVIPILLSFYFLIPFATTRIRAESGVFAHNYGDQSPSCIVGLLDMRRLGPGNLTVYMTSFLNMQIEFRYGFRAQMPHQLEALRIAKQNHISRKPLLMGILLTTVVGTLIAFWVELSMYYKLGAGSGYFGNLALDPGSQTFTRLQNFLVFPTTRSNPAMLFMGVGLLSVIFVAYMRTRFLWWPFHPIGMVMAGNEAMEDLWVPILVCWVLKATILKYGGHKVYSRAVPFFLGLALGDFALGSFWSILGTILNSNVYVYYP